jgi:two-component system, sensor histidine kinase
MDWAWLFDASQFLTRNHCGMGWTPAMETIYKTSNLTLALSYFMIPISLLLLYRKKRDDLPTPWVLILFILFIVLCGLTHLSDVVVFYWAPYRLFTLLYVVTALVSAVTAYRLPRVVRNLVKLPSREYVHKINDQLQSEVLLRTRAEQELACRNDKLRERVKTLEKLLKSNSIETLDGLRRTNQWIHERNAAMEELNKMVSEWEAI